MGNTIISWKKSKCKKITKTSYKYPCIHHLELTFVNIVSHLIFLFFIFLIGLYWSIIASQYCVSFCCITKRISHMHTHVPISPSSWASLPSSLSHPRRSSQSSELISLCYGAASHQPTILHSVVYTCWCYSHFTPASPSHPISSSTFSVSTSLFLPCNQVHQYHFFFDSIYMH